MSAKGLLCLLAFGEIFTAMVILLPRINADETPEGGYKPLPTNTSLIHPTLKDDGDDDADDDICFTDSPESSFLESPLIHGAIGGATVLGIILTTYACYSCCRRCSCQRKDIAGATFNLPRMVPLPPQFPISPSFVYKDEGITCLVNEG